jgi:hypothetical protein
MNSESTEVYVTEEQICEHLSEEQRQRSETRRLQTSSPVTDSNTESATPGPSSRMSKMLGWLLTFLGLGVDELTVAAASLSPQKLHSLGVLSPAQVDRICAEQTRTQFLIEDFLPAKSIAIAAGESTIGKSALICQLGLCVAAGVPFLGMPTDQGPVLYFDLENDIYDCKTMRDSLVQFLNLGEAPRDFLLVPDSSANLEDLLDVVRPKLVVFDSLRAYRPEVTDKNTHAAEWLQMIRSLSRGYGCTFLIVHHLRKTSREAAAPSLESCNVAAWLQEMEGPRAFVNQTDVRIAIAEGDFKPAALNLKWARRVRGDSPLMLVERMYDEDGEPVGYQHLKGARLLAQDKRVVYDDLPEVFCTADAKAVRRHHGLGDGNDPTNKFLSECKQLQIVENVGRGRWRKITTGA